MVSNQMVAYLNVDSAIEGFTLCFVTCINVFINEKNEKTKLSLFIIKFCLYICTWMIR